MSTVGVAIAGCFATSVVAVTGIAIFKGQLGGGRMAVGGPKGPRWSLCCALRSADMIQLHTAQRFSGLFGARLACLQSARALHVLSPWAHLPFLFHPADFHWLPTPEMLGSSAPEIAVRLLAVLPVISLSFICQ